MRNLIVVIAALTLIVTACKTSEANYRQAYQKAIEARGEADDIDSTVYGAVRRQSNTMAVALPSGRTMDVRRQLVRVTDGGGGIRENLHRYCVVAGQFKQRFNALSLRNRLVDNGFPGAFVVETAEPYYYILTGSYDNGDDALDALKTLDENTRYKPKSPCPFILEATAR